MILLWFAIAFLIAVFVARMYGSNKLFWILFMSFVTGIAGGAIGYRLLNGASKSKNDLVKVDTTVYAESQDTIFLLNPCDPAPDTVMSKPVEKVNLDTTTNHSDSSVVGHTDLITTNTPNKLCCTHISTHRDT